MSTEPEALLPIWLDRLAEQRLLMEKRDALTAAFSTWLELLFSEVEGDEKELQRMVALHTKGLGYERRPASAVVMQLLVLEDLLREHVEPGGAALQVVRKLIRVAADAQALGRSERTAQEHLEMLADSAMVFRTTECVVACMIGPMRGEIMDTVIGRMIKESIGAATKKCVLDLSGADTPDERFCRTIRDLLESTELPRIDLVICGIEDIDALRAGLDALGVSVPLKPTLNDVLCPSA